MAYKVTEDGAEYSRWEEGGSWEEKVGPREQMRWGTKLTRLERAELRDSFLKTVSWQEKKKRGKEMWTLGK